MSCVQLLFVSDNYPEEQSWTMSADGVELGSGDGSDATYTLEIVLSVVWMLLLVTTMLMLT